MTKAIIQLWLMDKDNKVVASEHYYVRFDHPDKLKSLLDHHGKRLVNSHLHGVKVHILCNTRVNPFCMYDVWTS